MRHPQFPPPPPSTITKTTALLCQLVRLERLSDNRLLGHFALHKMRDIFKHSQRICIFHSTMFVSTRTTRQPTARALLPYKSCRIFPKFGPNGMHFSTRRFTLHDSTTDWFGPSALKTRTDIF